MSDFIDVLLDEMAAEGDEKKPTHRLFGIRPGEISFVDRGANKKKWAVIKRDPNMTTETKTSPEDQAVVAAVVAKDGEEVPAGGGLPEPGAPPAAEGEAPAAMKIPGPVKQEILQTMTAALESLVDLANRVKSAEETSGDSSELPTELREEISAVQEMLGGIANRGPAENEEKPAGEPEADDPEKASAPPAAPAPAVADPQKTEVDTAATAPEGNLDILSQLLAAAQASRGGDVAKANVDPAKLQEALGALDQVKDLLKQFEGLRAVAEAVSAPPATSPVPEPAVDTASQAQLKDLTEQVQNLVGVVKQHERVMSAVQSQPQSSNAAPAEGGAASSGSKPFSWGVGDFNQVAQREAAADK